MKKQLLILVFALGLLMPMACEEEKEFDFSNSSYRPAELSSLILIPAGSFVMGSQYAQPLDLFEEIKDEGFSDEWPQRLVMVDAFFIEATEVSNAQYRACVFDGGCLDPMQTHSPTHDDYYINPEFDDFPVTWVTHDQAAQYCQWAGRALPTEAQWEKAARGEQEQEYPWGHKHPTCQMANFSKIVSERLPDGSILFTQACFGETVPVDFFANFRSPYGVYNMAGNAAEWVADWYHGEYYDSTIFPNNRQNPTGPSSGIHKVYRGGSFADNDYYIRTSFRGYAAPKDGLAHVGFRCAM